VRYILLILIITGCSSKQKQINTAGDEFMDGDLEALLDSPEMQEDYPSTIKTKRKKIIIGKTKSKAKK
jgi:hypothetical protein